MYTDPRVEAREGRTLVHVSTDHFPESKQDGDDGPPATLTWQIDNTLVIETSMSKIAWVSFALNQHEQLCEPLSLQAGSRRRGDRKILDRHDIAWHAEVPQRLTFNIFLYIFSTNGLCT